MKGDYEHVLAALTMRDDAESRVSWHLIQNELLRRFGVYYTQPELREMVRSERESRGRGRKGELDR